MTESTSPADEEFARIEATPLAERAAAYAEHYERLRVDLENVGEPNEGADDGR